MNWLDIVVLVVVGYSTFSGFRKGLTRAVIGIAATILGIIFGFSFYQTVADHLLGGMSSRELAKLLGFLIIFIGFHVAGALLAGVLAKAFRWIGLSGVDRLLGAGFGFFRGAVIVTVLVTVMLAFRPQPVEESKTLPFVLGASNVLSYVTPQEVKDRFREAQEKVKQMWSNPIAPQQHGRPGV